MVLYGLPAVAAGAILAHECTHAHIRLDGGQGLILVPISAQLELTLPLSAHLTLILSPM